MESLLRDARHALRLLRRRPGFAAAVVATLALGIGGNSAVFSVMNNVFLRPLPFAHGERLLRIRAFNVAAGGERLRYNVSDVEFLALSEVRDSFEVLLAARGRSFNLAGEAAAERVSAADVSPGYWRELGVEPVLGRHFSSEEERLGPDAGVALIGHGLWQRRFGGAAEVVGRTLRLDGRPFEVIGVLRAGLRFPYEAEIWVPGRFDPTAASRHALNVLARPRPGLEPARLRARLDAVAEQLARPHPESNRGSGLDLESARANLIADRERTAVALMAAVGFLLLIACANVASLLLGRAVGRRQELAVRAALGAGRGRIARQLLVESLALSLLGGGLGLLLCALLAEPLARLVPPTLSQLDLGTPRLDGRVTAFTLLTSLLTGVLFGSAPAFASSRVELRDVLQTGGRSLAGGGRRLLAGLAVAEIAVALVLLSGAAGMIRQFQRLSRADLGFETRGLATMSIAFGDRHRDGARRAAFVDRLREELHALLGVSAAGITTVNPLCCGDWGARISVEGLAQPPDAAPFVVHHRYVTPDLFPALGIRLMRGRLFEESDTEGAEPVVIVDARMARRFWPDADPLGRRVKRGPLDSDEPWLRVIGVVTPVRDAGDYTETWYLPWRQYPTGPSSDILYPMVRAASGAAESLLPALRAAAARAEPELAVFDLRSMDAVRSEELEQESTGAAIAAAFGGFGLMLAALGVFGVISLGIGQRAGEIGVRMALGARRSDVTRMVLGEGARLIGLGAALGLVAVLVLDRALAALVLGMPELEAGPLAAAGGLLALAALAACWLPARRAAAVDPATTLRQG